MGNQKRRGPEPLPPEARRRRRISVYVTGGEYQEILRKAGGIPRMVATYCRNAALDKVVPPSPPPEVNLKLWADLARLAANLNQLQRAINEGRVPPTPVLEQTVADLYAEVAGLRLALLGGMPEGRPDESDG